MKHLIYVEELDSKLYRNVLNIVNQYKTPTFVIDLKIILENYQKLKEYLPNANHHYAIKALPHYQVIKCLDEAGCFFEYSSNKELDLIKKITKTNYNIFHTHPYRKIEDIEYCLANNSNIFVIDSEYELKKMLPYKNQVKLILRLAFKNDSALINLSEKFGIIPTEAYSLLLKAKKMGFIIYGLSFHVGSQCTDSVIYESAINFCNQLILKAKQENGIEIKILDIGGGFPCDYQNNINFNKFFNNIRKSLTQLPKDIKVLTEPGRFLVANSAFTLVSVVGKKKSQNKIYYYLDDGVYGSLSGQVFDQMQYNLKVFVDKKNTNFYSSDIFGPTCDSYDVICKNILIPELNINDIILVESVGAYSIATSTNFNSVKSAKVVTVDGLINFLGGN